MAGELITCTCSENILEVHTVSTYRGHSCTLVFIIGQRGGDSIVVDIVDMVLSASIMLYMIILQCILIARRIYHPMQTQQHYASNQKTQAYNEIFLRYYASCQPYPDHRRLGFPDLAASGVEKCSQPTTSCDRGDPLD